MTFSESGLAHYEGFFQQNDIGYLEAAIVAQYSMQAAKLGLTIHGIAYGPLGTLLETMEGDHKEALYQVQKLLPKSAFIHDFFGLQFRDVCADLLGCKRNDLLIDGPGLLINRPNTTRLLYKWHSEAHYYPKRRRFLNIWFPVFGDKTRDNGVMSVKLGSHKKDWPFAEYQEGQNAFRQFEVPENFVSEYPEHFCESKRGDLIIFDRNLIHRSNPNTSDKYSFACVVRAWTPEDDLTLSGDFDVAPYSGKDYARPGLVVRA